MIQHSIGGTDDDTSVTTIASAIIATHFAGLNVYTKTIMINLDHHCTNRQKFRLKNISEWKKWWGPNNIFDRNGVCTSEPIILRAICLYSCNNF